MWKARTCVDNRRRPGRAEPIFDLPQVLVVIIAVLAAVQLLRDFLPSESDDMVLALFAFIPDRFILDAGQPGYPGDWGAMVWTFFTHAALHGSWPHLLLNAVVLASAGRPVVFRLGTLRFLALVLATAVGGAAVHLAIEWGSEAPMIGASGVVFGVMGAMLRFLFIPPDRPVPGVWGALKVAQVRSFIAALTLMNVIMVVTGTAPFGGGGGTVAWGAHLGGFLVGFFGFRLFDPGERPPAW